MSLILVTGGARSGKSRYAQRRARELGGDDVTVVATARPGDAEMRDRIARHRAERPAAWVTVEAPDTATAAVRGAGTDVVLLDCFTVLAANILLTVESEAGRAASPHDGDAVVAIVTEAESLIRSARRRPGTLIVVTNEVGLGVVPASRLGRQFRDGLGAANQRLAAAADEVRLLVSGLSLRVKPGVRPQTDDARE